MQRHRLRKAATAFTQVLASDDSDAMPVAAYYLGSIFEHRGDFIHARMYYEQAKQSGHAQAAAMAAERLPLIPVFIEDSEEFLEWLNRRRGN
jgi:hypothetical protein